MSGEMRVFNTTHVIQKSESAYVAAGHFLDEPSKELVIKKKYHHSTYQLPPVMRHMQIRAATIGVAPKVAGLSRSTKYTKGTYTLVPVVTNREYDEEDLEEIEECDGNFLVMTKIHGIESEAYVKQLNTMHV